MEEDIKILEDLIEASKIYLPSDVWVGERDGQAIENLINRVKELEKENKQLKKKYNHTKEIIDKYYDLTNKIYTVFTLID